LCPRVSCPRRDGTFGRSNVAECHAIIRTNPVFSMLATWRVLLHGAPVRGPERDERAV